MQQGFVATYRGAVYPANIGPGSGDVVLFSDTEPPADHGFERGPAFWYKQVDRGELSALEYVRTVGEYRGEHCLVLGDRGDRLHIAYLGHDAPHAEELGYWMVDRGAYEVVVARDEVLDIMTERVPHPVGPAPAAAPAPPAGGSPVDVPVARSSVDAPRDDHLVSDDLVGDDGIPPWDRTERGDPRPAQRQTVAALNGHGAAPQHLESYGNGAASEHGGRGFGAENGFAPDRGLDRGTGQGFAPGTGPGFGAGQDFGPGDGSGAGSAFGPAAGREQGFDGGPGHDSRTGNGVGPGAGSEQGYSPGADQDFGPGLDRGFGAGTGPGLDTGNGFGPAAGPGMGQGTVPGAGNEQGFNPGAGQDFGSGPNPAFGPGTDPGFGPGTDPGFRPVAGNGFGGAGVEPGFGPGAGNEQGFNPGAGQGFGSGPNPAFGSGPNRAFDAGPRHGFDAGTDSEQGPGPRTGAAFGADADRGGPAFDRAQDEPRGFTGPQQYQPGPGAPSDTPPGGTPRHGFPGGAQDGDYPAPPTTPFTGAGSGPGEGRPEQGGRFGDMVEDTAGALAGPGNPASGPHAFPGMPPEPAPDGWRPASGEPSGPRGTGRTDTPPGENPPPGAPAHPGAFGDAPSGPNAFGAAPGNTGFGGATSGPNAFGGAPGNTGFGEVPGGTGAFGDAPAGPNAFGEAPAAPGGYGEAPAVPDGFGDVPGTGPGGYAHPGGPGPYPGTPGGGPGLGDQPGPTRPSDLPGAPANGPGAGDQPGGDALGGFAGGPGAAFGGLGNAEPPAPGMVPGPQGGAAGGGAHGGPPHDAAGPDERTPWASGTLGAPVPEAYADELPSWARDTDQQRPGGAADDADMKALYDLGRPQDGRPQGPAGQEPLESTQTWTPVWDDDEHDQPAGGAYPGQDMAGGAYPAPGPVPGQDAPSGAYPVNPETAGGPDALAQPGAGPVPADPARSPRTTDSWAFDPDTGTVHRGIVPDTARTNAFVQPTGHVPPAGWDDAQPVAYGDREPEPPAKPEPENQARISPRWTFGDLVSRAGIPEGEYAVEEEVDGAFCLVTADDGFDVFYSEHGGRHNLQHFDDEQAAFYYLFGRVAAVALRSGRLAPPR